MLLLCVATRSLQLPWAAPVSYGGTGKIHGRGFPVQPPVSPARDTEKRTGQAGVPSTCLAKVRGTDTLPKWVRGLKRNV